MSALFLSVMSAYFLIVSVIYTSAKNMASLSRTYYGYNLTIAKDLAQQKAGTIIGFTLLRPLKNYIFFTKQ